MKKIAKRIFVFALCLVMSLNSLSLDVWADALADNGETVTDVSAVENFDVSGGDSTDVLDDDTEDVIPVIDEKDVLPDISLNDMEPQIEVCDVSDNSLEAIEEEEDLSDVFYRALSFDEENSKASLADNLGSVISAVPGRDYPADRVYTLADSEEDALEIAKAYSEASGLNVSLASYGEGVAVFELSENPALKGAANGNTVQCVVKLAADTANNLPVVSPDYYQYAHSVTDGIDTSRESFDDPFLKSTSDNFQWYHEKVNDKFAWGKMTTLRTTKLQGSTVAVLDSGVDFYHNELKDAVKVHINRVNSANETSQTGAEQDGMDTYGHGTNVCGIIGSTANYKGGRGVAAGVQLASVRVLNREGKGNTSDIIRGLDWCDENKNTYNIKVINISFGSYSYDALYEQTINFVIGNGILVVASAGNDNTQAECYPAAFSRVLSVASLNSKYERSSFSNYGSKVDIAAPGGDKSTNIKTIGLTDYEYIWSTGIQSGGKQVDGEWCSKMYGTSQAAPIVSAAAALVWAFDSTLSAERVKALLTSTARTIKTDKPVGAGCVDIAAACGVSSVVDEPILSSTTTSLKNGQLVTEFVLDFHGVPDGVIYYTTNGKTPDPCNMASTGTGISTTGVFEVAYKGKITLKALTVRYGQKSSVLTTTYTYDNKLVQSVSISSKYGYNEVAAGKKLTLAGEVLPTIAKNKKLKWTSSDTTIAKVDSKGVVTGVSVGDATITATATDGSGVFDSFDIKVKTPATGIYSSWNGMAMYDPSLPYIIDGKFSVYPEEASQNITINSSDPKVLQIYRNDRGNWIQKALKPGKVKITVTTADGTGVKKSIDVQVNVMLTKIKISPESEYLSTGKSTKMKAVLNDGLSIPSDKSLEWKIIEGSEYASIDSKTGKVTVKNININDRCTVKVQATANNDYKNVESNTVYLYIYPVSNPNYPYGQNLDDYVGAEGVFYNYASYKSDKACPYFTYKSSDSSVCPIDSSGYFKILKKGSATLTATPKDGSGKKLTLKITGHERKYDDASIEPLSFSTSNGIDVLYPGKKLTYKVTSAGSLSGRKFKLSASSSSITSKDADELISISGMTVSASSKAANSYLRGKQVKVYLGEKVYSLANSEQYEFIRYKSVFVYSAGTKEVKLNEGNSGINIEAGGYHILKPSSMPGNACQSYYQYKSSNTKVAKVSEDGVITAVAPGSAKITVTAGDGSGKTASIKVSVEKPVSSVAISLAKGVDWACTGKTLQINSKLLAADGTAPTNKELTWSLSNDGAEYVSIDSKGLLTVKKDPVVKRTVYVRATSKHGSGGTNVDSESIRIAICPKLASVDVSFGDVSRLLVGITARSSTIKCTAVNGKDITLEASAIKVTSSNTKVATAIYDASTNKVLVTGIKAGSATIKVEVLDGSKKSFSHKFTVYNKSAYMKLSAKGNQQGLAVGKKLQFSATPMTSDGDAATDKSVTWAVYEDDEFGKLVPATKATIDKKGLLTAVAPGKVYVRATATDNPDSKDTMPVYICKKAATKVSVTGIADSSYEYATETSLTLCSPNSTSSYNINKSRLASSCRYQVQAKGEYDDENYKGFSYKSSDTNVANVYGMNDGTFQIVGMNPGTATVTFYTTDGSNKSCGIKVKVIYPVTKMSVSTQTGGDRFTAGAKVQMVAAYNSEATVKKASWRIKEGDAYASIDSKGVLAVKNNITEPHKVEVFASPTDGGDDIYGASAAIWVYPKQTGIKVKAQHYDTATLCDAKTIKVKEKYTYTIEPKNPNSCGSYTISFKGNATVTYGAEHDPERKGSTQRDTQIVVKPTKTGKITLYCVPNDGSGKKFTYEINVTD